MRECLMLICALPVCRTNGLEALRASMVRPGCEPEDRGAREGSRGRRGVGPGAARGLRSALPGLAGILDRRARGRLGRRRCVLVDAKEPGAGLGRGIVRRVEKGGAGRGAENDRRGIATSAAQPGRGRLLKRQRADACAHRCGCRRMSSGTNTFGRYGREVGWGTWIRTRTNGVRVRGSTVNLFPNAYGRLVRPSRNCWIFGHMRPWGRWCLAIPPEKLFEKTRPTPTAKRRRIHGRLFMNAGLRCQAWMPAHGKIDPSCLCISARRLPYHEELRGLRSAASLDTSRGLARCGLRIWW